MRVHVIGVICGSTSEEVPTVTAVTRRVQPSGATRMYATKNNAIPARGGQKVAGRCRTSDRAARASPSTNIGSPILNMARNPNTMNTPETSQYTNPAVCVLGGGLESGPWSISTIGGCFPFPTRVTASRVRYAPPIPIATALRMVGQRGGPSPLILFGRKGESQLVRVLSIVVG